MFRRPPRSPLFPNPTLFRSRCVWCARELREGDASLDHVVPKLKGGPAWPENELAACRPCNRRRGHTSPALWLERSEEHTSELQSRQYLVCRLLLEKKKR